MFEHKVDAHQAYLENKWDSLFNMHERFLTGLASQIDKIMMNVSTSKKEVLEQLVEIKNKNVNLEIGLKEERENIEKESKKDHTNSEI